MKQEKEPAAIRELHRIRQKMLAEEKRVGSDKYWAEANRQGKEFARRHRVLYAESASWAFERGIFLGGDCRGWQQKRFAG
jgi:hypothetical protein